MRRNKEDFVSKEKWNIHDRLSFMDLESKALIGICLMGFLLIMLLIANLGFKVESYMGTCVDFYCSGIANFIVFVLLASLIVYVALLTARKLEERDLIYEKYRIR